MLLPRLIARRATDAFTAHMLLLRLSQLMSRCWSCWRHADARAAAPLSAAARCAMPAVMRAATLRGGMRILSPSRCFAVKVLMMISAFD